MRSTLAAPKRALQTARQLQLVVLAAAARHQGQCFCAGRRRHTSTHHRASCGSGQQSPACCCAHRPCGRPINRAYCISSGSGTLCANVCNTFPTDSRSDKCRPASIWCSSDTTKPSHDAVEPFVKETSKLSPRRGPECPSPAPIFPKFGYLSSRKRRCASAISE